MSRLDAVLEADLDALDARGLLRKPIDVPPGALVLCSNDYLGYARDPLPIDDDLPGGAGASRLVSGDHHAHREAEAAIAAWLGCEAAILLSSGFATNVSLMPALADPNDVIVSDAHNHASIIDGCRLSRASVRVVPHADIGAVEQALAASAGARRRWIVTESYFSMDGDVPDLAALRALADAHDAFLVVDEAHALGVFGEEGRGMCALVGIRPDVCVGTLGKAVGLAGAFVAGSEALRHVLWNRARGFVFSTGVVPWLASAATSRIQRVREDEAGRERLARIGTRVRDGLRERGVTIAPSVGPIVPWVVGSERRVMDMSEQLLGDNVFCQAIRPPTVPAETSRLRITLHARLNDAQIERALTALGSLAARGGSTLP